MWKLKVIHTVSPHLCFCSTWLFWLRWSSHSHFSSDCWCGVRSGGIKCLINTSLKCVLLSHDCGFLVFSCDSGVKRVWECSQAALYPQQHRWLFLHPEAPPLIRVIVIMGDFCFPVCKTSCLIKNHNLCYFYNISLKLPLICYTTQNLNKVIITGELQK